MIMKVVNSFLNAIERLLDSNVITAGREIRSFLITLTEDEETKDILRSVSSGYLINEDYKRVVIERGQLPTSDSKKVAFVTALLFAIDTGRLDLSDLLKKLFPQLDTADGYSEFTKTFLRPYAESFVNLAIGEPIPDIKEPKTPILDKMESDVTAAVNEIIANVASSYQSEEIKANVKFAGNGLIYALTFKDSFLTEIAYNGLMVTLRLYGVKTEAENLLTSTLRLYGVI